MKAPAFWWQPPGLASGLLGPAAALYGAVAAARIRRSGERASVPVICVGNVTVGGAGKTPTAIALAALLRSLGQRPAFLTRGHGGRLAGPVRVDPALHDHLAVGDEPLLLCRHAPTIVARHRPAGAALAIASGADVIVMDDGLQNPSLIKTLGLAIFDGGVGIGNGLPLPAGPLRAPLASQWPLIDVFVVIGDGAAGDRLWQSGTARGIPVMRAHLVPDPAAAASIAGRAVLAFAGIGRPAKFYDTVQATGAHIVETRSFPDHHAFTAADIASLQNTAVRQGLIAITTEKDAIRLSTTPFRPRTLPVRLRFDDPAVIREHIDRVLRG